MLEKVKTDGLAPTLAAVRNAEMVAVPVNLCARIPDGVTDEAAAFTVIGAIALQGLRLVAPTLGEAVVVTGLGLIGLLTLGIILEYPCGEEERLRARTVYLRFSAPTYLLGRLYERLVNQEPGLWRLRVLLIAELRRHHHKHPEGRV